MRARGSGRSSGGPVSEVSSGRHSSREVETEELDEDDDEDDDGWCGGKARLLPVHVHGSDLVVGLLTICTVVFAVVTLLALHLYGRDALVFENRLTDRAVLFGSLFCVCAVVQVMAVVQRVLSLRLMVSRLERKLHLLKERARNMIDFVEHELRAPLYTVLGMTGELHDVVSQQEDNGDDAALKLVDLIDTSCSRLSSVLGDMLLIEQLQRAAMDGSELPQPAGSDSFVLEDLIDSVYSAFQNHALEVGVKLESIYSLANSADGYKTLVTGAPVWTATIMSHLLRNAIAYTPSAGRVTLSVSTGNSFAHFADADAENSVSIEMPVLRADQGSSNLPLVLQIRVSDTGIGIPARSAPHLFAPYTRQNIHNARRTGGTGLGLTLVNTLVETLGGVMTVSSERDKGTDVTVLLPLKAAGPLGLPATAIAQQRQLTLAIPSVRLAPRVVHRLSGGIMHIDDRSLSHALVVRLLQEAAPRIKVALANNGDAALELAQKRRVAGRSPHVLILMDAHTPGPTVSEVVTELRQSNIDSPVVALLDGDPKFDAEAEELVASSGVVEVVRKPLTTSSMLALVRAYVRVSRRRKAKHGDKSLNSPEQETRRARANRSGFNALLRSNKTRHRRRSSSPAGPPTPPGAGMSRSPGPSHRRSVSSTNPTNATNTKRNTNSSTRTTGGRSSIASVLSNVSASSGGSVVTLVPIRRESTAT